MKTVSELHATTYPNATDMEGINALAKLDVKEEMLVKKSKLADISQLTSIEKMLKSMCEDERKEFFHEPWREILKAMEPIKADPANADLSWAPDGPIRDVLSAVSTQWVQAELGLKSLRQQVRELHKEWERRKEQSQFTPPETVDPYPEIEGDPKEEKRVGWNKEWTWQQRAVFNWGLSTLQKSIAEREAIHEGLRRSINILKEFTSTVDSFEAEASKVIDLYAAIPTHSARSYVKETAPLAAKHKEQIEKLETDAEALSEEQRLLREADGKHLQWYHGNEVPGGHIVAELKVEEQKVRDLISSLPSRMDAALDVHRDALRELETCREEEIKRALRESEAFLARNKREQEACQLEMKVVQERFREEEQALKEKLRSIILEQDICAEEHARKTEERHEQEKERKRQMLLLEIQVNEREEMLRATIDSKKVELRYLTDVLVPLYHETAVTLNDHQKDAYFQAYDLGQDGPIARARCLLPLSDATGRLSHSLIGVAQDIDEILGAVETHIDFCEETHDPDREVYVKILEELQQKKAACIEEAHVLRWELDTYIQLWLKLRDVDAVSEAIPETREGDPWRVLVSLKKEEMLELQRIEPLSRNMLHKLECGRVKSPLRNERRNRKRVALPESIPRLSRPPRLHRSSQETCVALIPKATLLPPLIT